MISLNEEHISHVGSDALYLHPEVMDCKSKYVGPSPAFKVNGVSIGVVSQVHPFDIFEVILGNIQKP